MPKHVIQLVINYYYQFFLSTRPKMERTGFRNVGIKFRRRGITQKKEYNNIINIKLRLPALISPYTG